jgi:hypothetical protein
LCRFVVLGALVVVASELIPQDYYFLQVTLVTVFLLSPFAIGASSYFVFQRFTRVQYTLAESQRWVAERRNKDARRIQRRNRLRRWAVWIPASSVLLFCLFLDETWPPATHLLYPRSGRPVG